jgi:hypothetical protein
VQVTVPEAARMLGVSEHTVRRRLRSGDLQGHQVASVGGFTWIVEVPEERAEGSSAAADAAHTQALLETQGNLISTLQDQVESLKGELAAKNQQISELHVLLQQAQAALPAPRGRPWWKWWGRD